MSRELVRAAGGVVYTYGTDGALLLLLIQDRHRSWTLPKGHLERGESEEQAAVREVAEETGVDCTLEQLLGRVQYPIFKRGAWRDKQVAYFLARAEYVEPSPRLAEGISAARWLSPSEALAAVTYAQLREVLRLALRALEL